MYEQFSKLPVYAVSYKDSVHRYLPHGPDGNFNSWC